MRLLLDQNISFRVSKIISERYPLVKQVRELGLENSTDFEIWEYAKSNDYTIVEQNPTPWQRWDSPFQGFHSIEEY